MSPFAPMMAVAFAGNTMVAIVLWALSRREPGYLGVWALAFFAAALRYLSSFVLYPVKQAGAFPLEATSVAAAFAALGALLLLFGVYRLQGRGLPRLFVVGGAVVTAWTLAADLAGVPFIWRTAPPFLFIAFVDIRTGVAVLRSGPPSVGRRLAGWAFVVWGVHRADYPFLGQHEALAPWGFALATVFGFLIGMGLLLVHYDEARARLAENEDRFRSFFEYAAEGMFQSSTDGRLLRVNRALVEMLGYGSAEELLARPTSALYAEVRDRASLLERYRDTDVISSQVVLKRKDGRRIRVRVSGRKVRDAEGRPLGFEGAAHDVTEEEALQSRLREAEKMEALGRLAGGVAHDFNNLLTAILASADLALESLPEGNAATEELQLVREASEQAASLAGQLLTFSRRQPARRERVDLNELLTSSLPLLRRVVDESVRFELALGVGPFVVEIDPAQLQQVLFNLVLNARDAMPSGGAVTLRTACLDGAVRLEVRDEGHGMDEETRARAFEPFFSTKPPGRGTGLGLSSAYGIVSRFGGTLSLESAPGQGTTAALRLPLCDPDRAAPTREAHGDASTTSLAGRTVLLVEDQELVRNALARALERAGLSVRRASDGEEALRLLEAAPAAPQPVDLLITDVVMPGLTGPQLLLRLRERWPELPAVLVTGYSPESLDEVLEHPRSRVLIKPFEAGALLAAARELLEGERALEERVA